jgi:hypothetical protein
MKIRTKVKRRACAALQVVARRVRPGMLPALYQK